MKKNSKSAYLHKKKINYLKQDSFSVVISNDGFIFKQFLLTCQSLIISMYFPIFAINAIL